METNDNLKKRLHKAIPGGAHTYSRGDDQFPLNAPAILSHGKGAYVWGIDGTRYLDYGMGLRSVNLGYGNEEVCNAVYEESMKGNNLTRPSLTELKAAELMIDTVTAIDMVKFAKHGSTVTTAAVKLARAYTGRKYIAVPQEQPFFSFDDWFIGSTVIRRGTIEESASYTLKFAFNDIESLNKLFEEYPGQIAGVMMEAATNILPIGSFLSQVQSLCKKEWALFIVDEMITGFRWHLNGAQKYYDLDPDLTTFGKAMANGFAVAALGGKKEIMELGSILTEGAERVFLTSTTHGAEMSALGAFIKTAEVLKRDNVIDHFWSYGEKLMRGFNDLAEKKGIRDFIYMEGAYCSPNYVTKDKTGTVSLSLRTIFAEQLLDRHVMMPYIALSASHGSEELSMTLEAVDKAMDTYGKALDGDVSAYLRSPVIKPVFRKYN
ncbi:MAG: glutamate-1-semialdehyde 2,1-aminomutase [Bacteroidetes bacterium]|nr:glutamate-1-semialdehyde 2,1-aminomutase [Bacteroidota bacterium]